jgi:hypothetical protein
MLDDLVRLGTNCARMARFMIDSLKFRADILYNVYREMRRTYRALIATAAQSMGIDDAAITREERQMSRHGADDQCGAVIAYWATYYLSRNWQCSFCGASGVVDTRGRALNESGQDQGALQFFLRCTNRDCYHALCSRRHQAPPFCWPIEELLKLALAIIELERANGSPVTSSKRRLITPVVRRPLGPLWSRVAPAGNKPGTQSHSAAPSRRRTSPDRARSRRTGDWRADVSPMRPHLTRSRRRFASCSKIAFDGVNDSCTKV